MEINMDNFSAKTIKTTIVKPNKYSAWPLIGSVNGTVICVYTVADRHVAADTSLFMKTSKDGLAWSEAREIFIEKNGVKGITGVGYNSEGEMLLWYRNGLWGRSADGTLPGAFLRMLLKLCAAGCLTAMYLSKRRSRVTRYITL